MKQEKFARAYFAPDSKTCGQAEASALIAGYSAKGADRLLSDPTLGKLIQAAFAKAGITREYLAGKHKALLEALETKHFSHQGIVTEERTVEDNYTRFKALELAYRALGDLAHEAPVAQAALILRVPTEQMTEEEWNAQVTEVAEK